MIRKIVNIDAEKCNGCGACAAACHEGAIVMINGKARLIKDDYCDGLGDCLPACPADAITIIEREAAAYDHEAVMNRLEAMKDPTLRAAIEKAELAQSQLRQWPVQIKLVPIRAPFFNGCKLLIAADCTAYAYGNFHQDFIADHVTLIGCPKLDATNYAEKLAEIFRQNDIREITVTRMTVPCCGGMGMAVQQALAASGKEIPVSIVTINTDGSIVS
ncbi:MAG: 4Fe-4S binding protein [Lachnospiraceae bacterium]|nr:4Fe-4S binding protein [Lachnospiraceae bacterium]